MTTPGSPASPSRRLAISAFGAVTFVALVIAGLGMLSLLTESDVIAVEGLGQVPGVVAVVVALLGWLAVIAPATRRRFGVGTALVAGLTAGLCHVLTVLVATTVSGGDPALAAGVAGRLISGGFAPVVAGAGLLAGTGAAVLRRSGSGTAQWPWEKDDPEP